MTKEALSKVHVGVTCDMEGNTIQCLGKFREREVLSNQQRAQYLIHYLIVL